MPPRESRQFLLPPSPESPPFRLLPTHRHRLWLPLPLRESPPSPPRACHRHRPRCPLFLPEFLPPCLRDILRPPLLLWMEGRSRRPLPVQPRRKTTGALPERRHRCLHPRPLPVWRRRRQLLIRGMGNTTADNMANGRDITHSRNNPLHLGGIRSIKDMEPTNNIHNRSGLDTTPGLTDKHNIHSKVVRITLLMKRRDGIRIVITGPRPMEQGGSIGGSLLRNGE
mmetsp:Transcript_25412/g.50949  ORF Transcript_25412/g.50949 Transcript_25412/m.50949 type:complete len:225 (-) Transcript_25412:301-975(-)